MKDNKFTKKIKKLFSNKVDIILLSIFIVIIFLIVMLFSYAYYSVDLATDTSNARLTAALECIDVDYSETGAISLNENYPVTDSYAFDNIEPIIVTVTNNCSTNIGPVDYQISLSTIYKTLSNYVEEYIPAEKMRLLVTKTVGANFEGVKYNARYLTEAPLLSDNLKAYEYITNNFENDSSFDEYSIKDVYDIDLDSIENNQVNVYKIYLWIDYFEGDTTEQGLNNNSTKGLKFESSVALTINGVKYDPYNGMNGDNLASTLIEKGNMWDSDLEGDGYRFTGTTRYTCNYTHDWYSKSLTTQDECPTLYYQTRTYTANGSSYSDRFKFECPEDTADVTYTCEVIPSTKTIDTFYNIEVNNYMCFGTTNQEECLKNKNKYLYRIIGVFKDSSNNEHIKLIKYASLPSKYPWNQSYSGEVDWASSTIYTGLNGAYFLNNTDYDYMQNSNWLSKITNWTWSAVNTKTYSDSGVNYASMTPQDVYLHEMNRTTKTSTIGAWTTPQSKIGLMYASDYLLSLGRYVTSVPSRSTISKAWMHIVNNGNIAPSDLGELTMSRAGISDTSVVNVSWIVYYDGIMNDFWQYTPLSVRPVFYLNNDVLYDSGSGAYKDPIMIR